MGMGCQSYSSPISPCRVKPCTSNPIHKSPAPSRSLELLSPSGKGQHVTACSKHSINHSPHQRQPQQQLQTSIPSSCSSLSSPKPSSLRVEHGQAFILSSSRGKCCYIVCSGNRGISTCREGLRPDQERAGQKRGR